MDWAARVFVYLNQAKQSQFNGQIFQEEKQKKTNNR